VLFLCRLSESTAINGVGFIPSKNGVSLVLPQSFIWSWKMMNREFPTIEYIGESVSVPIKDGTVVVAPGIADFQFFAGNTGKYLINPFAKV
jgi:hypothetical protein